MLTTRDAAHLLQAAAGMDGLAAIAFATGCTSPPAPLDDEMRRTLLPPSDVATAAVCTGPGAIRALLVEVAAGTPLKPFAEAAAGRLSSRAPHVLWLLLITQRDGRSLVIAAWAGDRSPPRIRALLCDRSRVVDSDAESLRAMIAATGDGDLLTHGRWVEVLGRESLTRRFYTALYDAVHALAATGGAKRPEAMHELALLNVSRLLFLAFLQAKGWLDGDAAFLTRQFDRCMDAGGGFERRVLLPLFFGTLNTPPRQRAARARAFGRIPFLNGGLFTRTPLERAWRDVSFADEAYGVLLGDVLARYRFTAREDQATWSEAAIDPEMLGRAFEGLMAHSDRKASGTFFTPQSIVQRATAAALEESLRGHPDARELLPGLGGETLSVENASKLRRHLEDLTVLDPACGSGAFLVTALERIARLLTVHGDARRETTARRAVLAHSIFGVDSNPTAVWLCELRLWLSVLIDSDETNPARVAPLPNLDHNIRVGDSLAGDGFAAPVAALPRGATTSGSSAAMRQLRERYTRATGPRKATLARDLARRERGRSLTELDLALDAVRARRRDLVSARRMPDLFGERGSATRDQREAALELRRQAAALRRARTAIAAGGALPFSWPVYFPDVAAAGGFDVVVGNPPWVRLHEIPVATRAALRARFRVARAAPWIAEPTGGPRSPGVGLQLDLSAVFLERSCELARVGGVIALLLPSKLWSSLAGAGARRITETMATVRRVEDLTGARDTFDAAVYPSLLIASRTNELGAVDAGSADASPADGAVVSLAVHHRDAVLEWSSERSALAYDASAGAPWILLPAPVRRQFDALRTAGVPLGASEFGPPRLGVKCGHNAAFLVRVLDREGELAAIEDEAGRRAWIESALLRPVLRGEAVTRWRVTSGDDAIIWTHTETGAPLPELPPLAARWFGMRRRDLAARTDARRAARWWSLFRTDAGRAALARVVWCDVGRTPRAAYLPPGDPTVPLNTCYALRCSNPADAMALVALLNSSLAAAWLDVLAEPARGGYRRYFAWTVALLPLPHPWLRARGALSAVTAHAMDGRSPDPRELHEIACASYGLRTADAETLIAWTTR